MNRVTIVVALLLAGLVAAGCGNKGPLYLPGTSPGAAWPYPQPTPAPKPSERKPADVPATSDRQQ